MIWVESKPAEISCDVDRSVPRSKHLGFRESICVVLCIIHCTLQHVLCREHMTTAQSLSISCSRHRTWARQQTRYLPIGCFLKTSVFFYILETKTKQNKTFSLINLPEPYGNSEKSSSVSYCINVIYLECCKFGILGKEVTRLGRFISILSGYFP